MSGLQLKRFGEWGRVGSFVPVVHRLINLPPGSCWDLTGLGRSWKIEVLAHLNFFNSLTDIQNFGLRVRRAQFVPLFFPLENKKVNTITSRSWEDLVGCPTAQVQASSIRFCWKLTCESSLFATTFQGQREGVSKLALKGEV